jgi:sugar/nucleoside kinase (ribokinase family)
VAASPFVLVCGHTNVDIELRVRELPGPGRVSTILERHRARGGNACNIAVHAAALGVPVRLWSRVGPDFDPAWRADLERLGIDLSGLETDPGRATPACYIFTDLASRQAFAVDEGAMGAMAGNAPSPSLLQGVSWLHLAAGDPGAYEPLADAAAAAGIGVALDPGQEMRFRYDRASLARMLSKADVLFANDSEAAQACRILGLDAPAGLLRHVAAVVVTHAERGATLLRDGHPALESPAFPLETALDPTGAGDALRAGWYAALRAGRPWPEALRWGQAAGALSVQNGGGQEHPADRVALERLLATPRS